jgi:hypothetical protein
MDASVVRRSRSVRRGALRRAGVVLSGGVVLSCSGDTTAPVTRSPAQTYWALQLNQYALNLDLTHADSTFQLTAVALNAIGTSLVGNDSTVHFSTSDSSVTVSPTGLVVARFTTAQAQVYASLTQQNVTHTDTVLVQVTQTPPPSPIRTFSMQPAPGDSAKRAYDFNGGGYTSAINWPVTATTVAGDTVCNANACPLLVHYTSSNPEIATIDPTAGFVQFVDAGHVVFSATTWAYGMALRDSVAFTVGYRLTYLIGLTLTNLLGVPTLSFSAPQQLILGVGAIVTFWNQSPQPVDVVFDHPAAVDSASFVSFNGTFPPTGGGNIASFGGDTVSYTPYIPYYNINDFVARRFSVPGTYRYHSSLFPSETNDILVQQLQ